MAKIRDDFIGAIHVAGGPVLMAGGEVPAGVTVDASHLAVEPEKSAEPVPDTEPEAKPAPKRRPRKKASDAESVD